MSGSATRWGAIGKATPPIRRATDAPAPDLADEPRVTATVSRETVIDARLLPVAAIDSSPLNPRMDFDAASLAELAASMEADGLLQPITVAPVGDRYVIVAGERRWRAAQHLRWATMPAIVRAAIDDATHVRLALLENLARTDLNPLEEARGYQQLVDLGMTQEQIAEAVHRSRPAIANALRLLKAPEPVQQKLRSGEISTSHVLALLRYEAFPEALLKIAERAAEHRTPSKELEKGLPYEFTGALTESKLAVGLYRAEFDRAVCEACPFGAHIKGGPYDSYCLKPEHFRELQKEVRDKRKAETKAALEAAATPDGPAVLQLRSLKYGQYERLDYGAKPKACTAKCECRRAALDGTRTIQVCVKPARFRQLKDEERRKEEADRKARQKDLGDRCGQILDQVDQVRARELTLVAGELCSGLDEQTFKALLAKHGIQWKSRREGAIDFEGLAHLQPLALVKLAAEAVLSHDIRNSYRGSPLASWYAGPPPKASKASKPSRKGKPRPEPFDPNASVVCARCGLAHTTAEHHLAEEIASEQERLEREFAAESIEQDLAEFAGAAS